MGFIPNKDIVDTARALTGICWNVGEIVGTPVTLEPIGLMLAQNHFRRLRITLIYDGVIDNLFATASTEIATFICNKNYTNFLCYPDSTRSEQSKQNHYKWIMAATFGGK